MKRRNRANLLLIRTVTLLLCAVLFIPLFRPVSSALPSSPGNFIEQLLKGLAFLYQDIEDGVRVGAEHFRREVEETARKEWGHCARIEGGRLYTMRGPLFIQIGDLFFDRYDFGTRMNSDFFNDILTNRQHLYYVPFFIYRDDLYIAVGTQTAVTIDVNIGHQFYRILSGNFNGHVGIRTAGFEYARTVGAPSVHATISQNADFNTVVHGWRVQTFSASQGEITWNNQPTPHTWVNVSDYLRWGSWANARHSVAQIFGSIPADERVALIHNFSPNEQGIGMFIVDNRQLPHGMNFHQYLRTLEPNDFIGYQPEIEVEVNLPPAIKDILDRLGDDDEVEIVRCPDTGNVTFNIVNNNTTNNNGGGSFDDSRILGYLRLILTALLTIPEIIIDFWVDFVFDYADSFSENYLRQIRDENRLTNSILQGFLTMLIESFEYFEYYANLCRCTCDYDCECDDLCEYICDCCRCVRGGGTDDGGNWFTRGIRAVGGFVRDIFTGGGDLASGIGAGLGDFFSGAGEGAGSFASGIGEAVSGAIGGIFGGVADGLLGAILDLVGTIVELPVRIIEAIAGMDLFGNIVGLVQALLDFLGGLIDTMITAFTDLFITLFVPSEGFISITFGDLNTQFNAKFPAIEQARDIFDEFERTLEEPAEVPEFEIGGGMFGDEPITLSLGFLSPYLPLLHAIIIGFSYYKFIRKVIKRLPSLIGGVQSVA
jgi:hypothetical protein